MPLLVAAMWIAAFAAPVAADDARPGYADLARELAEGVGAGPGAEPLEAWPKAVIERALNRAGRNAGPASAAATALPRVLKPRAGTDGTRGGVTAEVLLFTSLAVPAASWRAAARDAARIGAPLVLRGVVEGSLPGTARRIASRVGDAQAGVAIDPRLFRLFRIARVPAVVVVPGGVPLCRDRGCAAEAPPPFDRVTGNLSLAASLEVIAAEGAAGRTVARRHLATLRGTER